MSAQHTPGPWGVLDHHGVHVLAEGGLTIASVAHQLHFVRVPGSVQLLNAHLIAAAPELLAMLRQILNAEFWDGVGHWPAADEIRELINRAEGRAL